jgi:hypothetical protein
MLTTKLTPWSTHVPRSLSLFRKGEIKPVAVVFIDGTVTILTDELSPNEFKQLSQVWHNFELLLGVLEGETDL